MRDLTANVKKIKGTFGVLNSSTLSEAPSLRPVCWVLISTTPYHHARFAAFAANTSVRPVLLELTDQDPFKCLEFATTSAPYKRLVLCPGLKRDDMTSKRLRPLLSRALDQISPAAVCVNGWSLPGSVDALLWCASNQVPAVIFSESAADDASRFWWKEGIKRRLLSLASAVLVGGRLHAEYVRRLGVSPERLFLGYDAVDNSHFELGADDARSNSAVLRGRLGLPDNYFLACCRFEPKKNLARLLEAYSLYRAQAGGNAWSLVLAGDGPDRASIESLAIKLAINDTVIFLGPRVYGEMPALYGLASAFVHASTTEQWGLVVNEAAAAGLPLLVSERCGCAPDLVQPGVNGFLFNPRDPQALAGAMISVASDHFDRTEMGSSARNIVRNWSPQRFAAGLAEAVRTATRGEIPKPSLITTAILRALSIRPVPRQ